MAKSEQFEKDFKAIQHESARHACSKLKKYRNQRLAFQATELVKRFLKGLDVVPDYKPSMRIEGVLYGIYKEPVSKWTIGLRKVIITDGDTKIMGGFERMKLSFKPQDLFGGQGEVNKADGF